MLCIALRAAFGRLSTFARLSRPSNASQAKKTRNPVGESKKGRLAALPARLHPAAGMRPRVRLAIRLSCSRAALSNFFTGSKACHVRFLKDQRKAVEHPNISQPHGPKHANRWDLLKPSRDRLALIATHGHLIGVKRLRDLLGQPRRASRR